MSQGLEIRARPSHNYHSTLNRLGSNRTSLVPHTNLTRLSTDSPRRAPDAHPIRARSSPDPHAGRSLSAFELRERNHELSAQLLQVALCAQPIWLRMPSQVARGRRSCGAAGISELAATIQVVSKGPRASDLRQAPAAPSWLKGSGPSLTWAPGFGFRAGLAEMIE